MNSDMVVKILLGLSILVQVLIFLKTFSLWGMKREIYIEVEQIRKHIQMIDYLYGEECSQKKRGEKI